MQESRKEGSKQEPLAWSWAAAQPDRSSNSPAAGTIAGLLKTDSAAGTL